MASVVGISMKRQREGEGCFVFDFDGSKKARLSERPEIGEFDSEEGELVKEAKLQYEDEEEEEEEEEVGEFDSEEEELVKEAKLQYEDEEEEEEEEEVGEFDSEEEELVKVAKLQYEDEEEEEEDEENPEEELAEGYGDSEELAESHGKHSSEEFEDDPEDREGHAKQDSSEELGEKLGDFDDDDELLDDFYDLYDDLDNWLCAGDQVLMFTGDEDVDLGIRRLVDAAKASNPRSVREIPGGVVLYSC